MAAKVCLFFIAGTSPTAGEQVQINVLSNYYNVKVRNAAQSLVGSDLEGADALAGLPPTAYTDAIADYADGDVTATASVEDVLKPDALIITPAAAGPSTFAATGVLQLSCVKAKLNRATGVVVLTDITAAVGMAWTSATVAKATIGAATGLATGVAAGTSVITATYTYDTAKTMVATRTVTCT